MISLIYLSYRPGGFDFLAHSLEKEPKEGWELVIVDDLPGRVYRGEASKFLLDKGIPLAWHGGSKEKSRPETKGGLANAMNTGVLNARGDAVVFLHDFICFPEGFIKRWQDKFADPNENKLVSGVGLIFEGHKPEKSNDVWTWPGEVVQLKGREWWIPDEFEGFYAGFPTRYVEEINGFEELTDHCACWVIHVIIDQALAKGWSLEVDKELTCNLVDHRMWDDTDKNEPTDTLWRIKHHTSLEEVPMWGTISSNPYDFAQLRRETLAKRGIQI